MSSDGSKDWLPQLGGVDQRITGREPELSGLRALLPPPLIVHVDDDPGCLDLMQLILRRRGGYRVESFQDGRAALAFVRHTRPALLITDVSRPFLDGLTLCRILRDDVRLHNLPIIVHSGYTPHALILERLDLVGHSKPLHMDIFLETVNQLVNESR